MKQFLEDVFVIVSIAFMVLVGLALAVALVPVWLLYKIFQGAFYLLDKLINKI